MDLAVTRESEQAHPVVAVSGDVDLQSAPALREALLEMIAKGDTGLVVDLTNVSFLDSTGLGALVTARTAASEAGAGLSLVCTSERVLKLFTITGLDGVFLIRSTVDDALSALIAEKD